MFNFYNPLKIFFLYNIMWYSSSSIIFNTHFYVNWLDIFYRLWLNDFIINSYYFFWTSFWYLIVVVGLSKIALVWLQFKNIRLWYVFIWLIPIIYFFSLYNYWSYVFIFEANIFWESQINVLLTNSINKYHPFIFYSSLIWFYVILIICFTKNSSLRFQYVHHKSYSNERIIIYLSYIFFTLSLGSWWALQEGSWGGWWNWDSSEVFGLLIMLAYVQLLHQVSIKTSTLSTQLLILISAIYIYLVYILIQLNFDLVSHNFGTKVTQFISSDQLYYLLALMVIIMLQNFLIKKQKTFNNYCYLFLNKPFLTKVFLLTFIVFVAVLLSLSELLNNFYWLLLGSNFANILNVTTYYTPLTIIVLYIAYVNLNLFNIIFLSLLTFLGEYIFALIFLLIRKNPITLLHIYIYVFIFISYQCLNHSLVYWAYLHPNNYNFISDLIIDNYGLVTKLNTSYIECSFFTLAENQLNDTGWSFFHKTTNLQSHPFQHNLNTSNTFQGLLVSIIEYTHNITVWDGSSNTLGVIVLLILSSVFILNRKHILIIF